MARQLRIEYSGAFYHVMHRGNAGADIFKSDRDREKFLEYVGKAVTRYEIKIHTYCLMTNHYHFLIETPQPNLSQAIKWINVSYVAYFNRKRRRTGHLFQGRFKAIVIDADEYLKHLSRYIHLNPVRAGMVKYCKDYPWSSYRVYGGYAKAPEWMETNWLLSLFSANLKKGKERYRDFIESVENEKIDNPSKDIVGGIILGGTDFVNWIKRNYLSNDLDTKEKPQLKRLQPGLTAEDLVAKICQQFSCTRDEVLQKGKKGNLVRDLAIFLSRELTGESGVALGRLFGISGAGITVRHGIVAEKIERDRKLKGQINRIKKTIINN